MEPEKPQKQYHGKKPKEELNFSHFLSIPLISKKFKEKMRKLQLEALNLYPDQKKQFSFNDKNQFHITISMLDLNTKEKEEKGLEIMKKYEGRIEEVVSNSKFFLNIEKFDTFTVEKPGKPKKTVVYMDLVDDDNYKKIEKISDDLIKEFIKSDIINEKDLARMCLCFHPERKVYRAVQHHITFFSNVGPDVDITKMLQHYKEHKFEPVKCKGVDLSIRKDLDETGFYKPHHRIRFHRK